MKQELEDVSHERHGPKAKAVDSGAGRAMEESWRLTLPSQPCWECFQVFWVYGRRLC